MRYLHERAGDLLVAALSRPAAERDAFLVEPCSDPNPKNRDSGKVNTTRFVVS